MSSFIEPSGALLIAGCVAVSFLYSGLEAGLVSVSRVRLRSRAEQGDRGAIRLQRLLRRPERLLATVLLVTNFADVAALILLTEAFVRQWGTLGYVWSGVALLPLYLIGLQLLPKSLFRRFPYRALAALAPLLEATSRALAPVLTVGSWLTQRWFPADGSGLHGLFAAREEFKSLAAEGERVGALTAVERGLIHNVVDFSAMTARDFLQPKGATLSAESANRVADLLKFARDHGNPEHIAVVDAAGKLTALVERDAILFDRDLERPAASYLRRRPLNVLPADPASRVLRRLRAARLTAAGVEDAEGNFLGTVLTRDLLQRLVQNSKV